MTDIQDEGEDLAVPVLALLTPGALLRFGRCPVFGEYAFGEAPDDRPGKVYSTRDRLVLEVDDVHAERDQVIATGVAARCGPSAPPIGLTDFRILDPAGYYLRIMDRPDDDGRECDSLTSGAPVWLGRDHKESDAWRQLDTTRLSCWPNDLDMAAATMEPRPLRFANGKI